MNRLPVLAGLLVLLLWSCGSQPKVQRRYLTGNTKGLKATNLILYNITSKGNIVPRDTLEIHDTVVRYAFAPSQENVFLLSDGTYSVPVILGHNDVVMHADTTAFYKTYFSGDRSNDLLHTLYATKDSILEKRKNLFKELNGLTGEERKEREKELMKTDAELKDFYFAFARENVSLPGIMALIELTYDPAPEFRKIMDVYASYPPALKSSTLGKFLTYRLNTVSAGAVGTKAPNFTGLTPEGEQISLFGVMGKVTIIDFWASWCKPCRVQSPFMVKMYKKYHDSGLNIISVSLDKNKDAWARAIKQDGLEWFHVSHLKGWQEPIAKLYHVNFIPHTFILDSKGIIRAKNLHGEDFEKTVRALLNE